MNSVKFKHCSAKSSLMNLLIFNLHPYVDNRSQLSKFYILNSMVSDEQGTTGSPKGATLSHHNIVNNAYLTGLRLGYHLKVIYLPYRITSLITYPGFLTDSSYLSTGAALSLHGMRYGNY